MIEENKEFIKDRTNRVGLFMRKCKNDVTLEKVIKFEQS